jgi:tRNA(Ser,Leu) C12 N-acetylase TAN1
MKVIVHLKPDFKNESVRHINYSIMMKKIPTWWVNYRGTYFVESKNFEMIKIDILCYVLEELYESEHDIPNCEDCDQCEESYDATRRMMLEDRD